MAKPEKRNVLTADICFRDFKWHLHWTEDDGTNSTSREVKHRALDCRGRLNGEFARKEAAQFLGCSERVIGLEKQAG